MIHNFKGGKKKQEERMMIEKRKINDNQRTAQHTDDRE